MSRASGQSLARQPGVLLPLGLQIEVSAIIDDAADAEPWEEIDEADGDDKANGEEGLVNTGFTAMFLYHFWANYEEPAWRLEGVWDSFFAIPMWASKVYDRKQLLGDMLTEPHQSYRLPSKFRIILFWNQWDDCSEPVFQSWVEVSRENKLFLVGNPYEYKISIQRLIAHHKFYRPYGIYDSYDAAIYKETRRPARDSQPLSLPH